MARLDIFSTDRVLDISQIFLILQTIQHFAAYGSTVESHNQAFIQTDKHLTYIVGDNYINSGVPLEIKPGSSFPDLTSQDDNFFSNNIRLVPPMLDFQDQSVGMPRMENVIVQNNDPKHSLHLLSISGSTVHFHCSFFQDKIVPPGGNTSFDVVFLARQVGNVENTLFIHTSIGSIRYQVFGVGIPNPYRLRPYLGARVPINSSFTPVIQMHNPYSTSLQVLEMFASEGDLHLELPSGEREASRELWELKPFETKAVMKANFVARVESNHSAFIRIKTNKDKKRSGNSELLILPLEIEVSSDPGIYSPVELVDFGILRTLDEPKTLPLNLINSGPKAIHITSVNISPPNNAVNVEFRPFKLQPDGSRPTTVAHITFRAVKALQSKQWFGKIVIKTKNNIQRLVVPYQANVLHGSLVYNVNTTHFFSAKALWNVTRPMAFTNTFNFSVVIYNVSLPADVSPYFTIVNFSKPVIIHPQQTLAVYLLKFHPNQTQIHFNTMLTLSTNASSFSIPIIVYNGLMKVIHHRPEKFEGQLDFGTLGVGESRNMIFTIRNDNPVDIVVARFETNMTWASVKILGMERGNGTTLTRKHNQSEINIDPLYIKPYHYAVFNVSIVAPEEEGAYVADIWMFTQFQDLFIPITFRAAEGSLHAIPDKFVFEKVYPGRVPYRVLQIHSTFDDYMQVTQVTFQPADNRFYFTPQNSNTVLLQPHEHSIVGKIYFDAKRDCNDDCYVGLSTLSPAGHQWLLGMDLDRNVADTDQYLYTKLQQKWERLESLQQNIVNVTIELDTNQVRGFLFSAQAHMQWPTLVRRSRIKYPLTQIGNLSLSDFIVENPGEEAVLVQILPLSLYPNPHTILDLMSQRLSQDLSDYIESDETNTFILLDVEQVSKSSGTSPASLAEHRKTVEQTFGVVPHKQSLAALLQPGSKVKVKVGFRPKDDLSRSSLIVIRNNLTIIDAVVVQGQGRKGEMRFNNKKPGSHSALTFEMTEKHLKNCDTSEKKANKNIMPNFTVRRPFTLKNSGDLPFYIHGFSINDLSCEGYGFKVLDCSGFEMLPNSSRKINIAFTPDFTMSQIQRMLTIHTSLGPPASAANYSLQAMVPYDLLSQCSAALPRPTWEPVLYYFVIFLMGFIICCIVVLSYFESDRVMAEYIRKKLKITNSTQTFEKGKVFDLKSVPGMGVSPAQTLAPAPAVGAVKCNHMAPTQYTNGRLVPMMNGHMDVKEAVCLNQPSCIHSATSPHATTTSNTNGSRNSRRTFLGSLIKMVKSIALIKYFSSSKKSVPIQHEKPLSDSKDTDRSPSSLAHRATPDVSSNTAAVTEDGNLASPLAAPPHETTVLAEKSIVNNSNYSNRGRKGRLNHRRQIVVDASGDTSNITQELNSKKLKENNDPSTDSPPKKSSNAMIDDFDDSPIAKHISQIDHLEDVEDVEGKTDTKPGGKLRGGAKRNKSKTKSDNSSKDRLLFRRENTLPDDVDDVSSTTTESSGGDVEDKNTLGHDTTPDITTTAMTSSNSANNRRWKKGSNRNSERLVVVTHGGEMIDDDSNFEVTSKSKAHRKIRVNKETFGGDIMRPSTIELPYCLPNERERAENDASKKPRKPKKIPKGQSPVLYSRADSLDGSSGMGRESPPPVWDQPIQFDYDLVPGDLSELSIQTENFALKHARATKSVGPGVNPAGPVSFGGGNGNGVASGLTFSDRLPANGRSSSYSSIVSSSATGNGPEPLMRTGSGRDVAHPIDGSSLLDGSRYSSPGFSPFSESSLQGMVSPGLVSNKGSLPTGWTSNVPPVTTSDSSVAYGLQPIAETGASTAFSTAGHRAMDGFVYGNNVPVEANAMYPRAYPGGGQENVNQPQLTMMQQLQVERRRRIWEHQQKVNKEDWPGFNTPLVRSDSLWDNDYNPLEHTAWSTNADNVTGVNGFWSTLTNSASSGWSSLQSLANIWGSNPQPDSSLGTGAFVPSTQSPPSNPQLAPAPAFNPFTSMADIWSPTSNSGGLNMGGPTTPMGPSGLGIGDPNTPGCPNGLSVGSPNTSVSPGGLSMGGPDISGGPVGLSMGSPNTSPGGLAIGMPTSQGSPVNLGIGGAPAGLAVSGAPIGIGPNGAPVSLGIGGSSGQWSSGINGSSSCPGTPPSPNEQ